MDNKEYFLFIAGFVIGTQEQRARKFANYFISKISFKDKNKLFTKNKNIYE